MKAANKGAKAPAELPEGRASTKGNSQDQSTHRTQGRGSVSQTVERIRQAATRKPQEKLTALLHHITTDALRCAFYDLKKTASAGVDGLVWTGYEDGLEERLLDLHGRVHSGAYRALPSRRVEIPKPDGGTRPLGIAALEDKIVQKAVVDVILTPIYEPEFLGFSYGFRAGRGAHDALDALAFGIERRKVNWIIDADIRAFFDRLSRDHLLRFLEHRIGDTRVLRLIAKWLNAGVMEDDQWKRDVLDGALAEAVLEHAYGVAVATFVTAERRRAAALRASVGFARRAGAGRPGRIKSSPAASFSRKSRVSGPNSRVSRASHGCSSPGRRTGSERKALGGVTAHARSLASSDTHRLIRSASRAFSNATPAASSASTTHGRRGSAMFRRAHAAQTRLAPWSRQPMPIRATTRPAPWRGRNSNRHPPGAVMLPLSR